MESANYFDLHVKSGHRFFVLNDQANIAWFTSTRGVYQVWLDRSLTFEFAQVECLSCSVTNLLYSGLMKVHSNTSIQQKIILVLHPPPSLCLFSLEPLVCVIPESDLVIVPLSPEWTILPSWKGGYLCLRPYHVENTSSRLITEVKQHWAMLVLGWVTAWEYMVL